MIFSELNDSNYIMFAIKYYNSPTCVTKEEFFDDMKRFRHVKKLFSRYKKTGILKSHLILNHIITIYNLFDDAATPLLFFKIDKEYWSALKAFLIYLNRLTEESMPNIDVDRYCLAELNLI